MQNWIVLCDFDGTIAQADVTDTLLERFGRAGWRAAEQAWRRGAIGSLECLAMQTGLLDMDAGGFDSTLAGIAIDPAFAAFAEAVAAAGTPLVILSDGYDRAIGALLEQHGLGRIPVRANRLNAVGNRAWQLEFPYADAGCAVASGHCKCASARTLANGAAMLLVGDGASDACLAGRADMVFAKGQLARHCRERGIAHRAIDGFADALALLPDVLSGALTGQRHVARRVLG